MEGGGRLRRAVANQMQIRLNVILPFYLLVKSAAQPGRPRSGFPGENVLLNSDGQATWKM